MKYYDSAISLTSSEFDTLRSMADKHNIFFSVGATLYCTSVLIKRDGTLLFSHHKLIPTTAERLVWGQDILTGVSGHRRQF